MAVIAVMDINIESGSGNTHYCITALAPVSQQLPIPDLKQVHTAPKTQRKSLAKVDPTELPLSDYPLAQHGGQGGGLENGTEGC
jgi:hypothetical protein